MNTKYCLFLEQCSVDVDPGIGRATCVAIAKCGGHVIALSRTQSDLDSLKEEVKLGYPCMFSLLTMASCHLSGYY